MPRTWHGCRSSGARRPSEVRPRRRSEFGAVPDLLLVRVALLAPRVTDVVVAALLPEPAAVGRHVFDAPDPFGPLPGVQMRHDETQRESVFGGEQFAVLVGGEQRPVRGEVGDPEIRAESVFGPDDR